MTHTFETDAQTPQQVAASIVRIRWHYKLSKARTLCIVVRLSKGVEFPVDDKLRIQHEHNVTLDILSHDSEAHPE